MALTETTGEFAFYREVALSISDDIIAAGEELPQKWSDVEMVHNLRKNMNSGSISFMKSMNRLVLVPGAPVISSHFEGYYRNHYNGSRILAISRSVNYERNSSIERNNNPSNGRYAILIDPDGKSAWATWIKEDHAKKIIENIQNFDPEKQPQAFPDIQQLEQEFREHEEKVKKELPDFHRRLMEQSGNSHHLPLSPEPTQTMQQRGKGIKVGLLAAIVLGLLGGAWWIRTKRKPSH